jgi:hypothetical protein
MKGPYVQHSAALCTSIAGKKMIKAGGAGAIGAYIGIMEALRNAKGYRMHREDIFLMVDWAPPEIVDPVLQIAIEYQLLSEDDGVLSSPDMLENMRAMEAKAEANRRYGKNFRENKKSKVLSKTLLVSDKVLDKTLQSLPKIREEKREERKEKTRKEKKEERREEEEKGSPARSFFWINNFKKLFSDKMGYPWSEEFGSDEELIDLGWEYLTLAIQAVDGFWRSSCEENPSKFFEYTKTMIAQASRKGRSPFPAPQPPPFPSPPCLCGGEVYTDGSVAKCRNCNTTQAFDEASGEWVVNKSPPPLACDCGGPLEKKDEGLICKTCKKKAAKGQEGEDDENNS